MAGILSSTESVVFVIAGACRRSSASSNFALRPCSAKEVCFSASSVFGIGESLSADLSYFSKCRPPAVSWRVDRNDLNLFAFRRRTESETPNVGINLPCCRNRFFWCDKTLPRSCRLPFLYCKSKLNPQTRPYPGEFGISVLVRDIHRLFQ
jgi:hypothetical protein